MSNEIFSGLLWNSRAGVVLQALDLATQSDRPDRERKSRPDVPPPRRAAFDRASTGLPSPLAAAGLIYIGAVLGAALVATLIT